MNDKPELKPCPFCGGEAEKYFFAGMWFIRCEPSNNCEVNPCSSIEGRIDILAIKAWNRRADLAKPSEWISGLKDHEIQELVNAIRDNLLCLDDLVNMGPLREMIGSAAIKYLEGKKLRIDKPSPPNKECGV